MLRGIMVPTRRTDTKMRSLSGKEFEPTLTANHREMLMQLQSKPVYQGTVPRKVIRVRRAAAKVARKSRRGNR